jgi:hypothetical protein
VRGGPAWSRDIPQPAPMPRESAPLSRARIRPETSAQHARSPAAKLRLRQLGSLRRKSVIRAARPQRGPVPATKDERPLWVR